MNDESQLPAVIAVDGARKSFGAVKALDGVDFTVAPGQCIGLVGHNGAGKSTLVNVINGGITLDQGTIALAGQNHSSGHSIARARSGGIRCVFQELSLCPNLTVLENVRIAHRTLTGFGWRTRAAKLISAQLDTIFPGHGISAGSVVGDLSIAQRQMVEIATAFSRDSDPVALVILDEPTSSLDASRAHQLIEYVKTFTAEGGAVIFISHILGEILEAAHRVIVMRDGKVVGDRPASEFTVPGLVQAMGSVAAKRQARRETDARASGEAPVVARPQHTDAVAFRAFRGELVGLAGLSGHGQTETLVDLYKSLSSDWRAARDPKAAFVAGDRLIDGIFPIWSILRNMSITVLADWSRRGFVDVAREIGFGGDWKQRIGIRSDDLENPILSLSGGNQQKALFARALGSRAEVVLMDDPMRGVDIGTKQDVYAMLRQEADKGRTFVWYSTEMDEVSVCDRVYVFRDGRIVAELAGDAVSEDAILAASFGERAA
ncbi:sugar ABC transporter ATP-binding protein [Pelagibacterium montanilacus]|uniref:sugar ABC transporter ATP-binding protein n=1 Tax=Pelagibacterium montanilacus TaxID=2185280 RepID=UPI000F8D94FB|nr:sugar ABC transporter ATP-binding protein [Pelagibacterium montanilacus]